MRFTRRIVVSLLRLRENGIRSTGGRSRSVSTKSCSYLDRAPLVPILFSAAVIGTSGVAICESGVMQEEVIVGSTKSFTKEEIEEMKRMRDVDVILASLQDPETLAEKARSTIPRALSSLLKEAVTKDFSPELKKKILTAMSIISEKRVAAVQICEDGSAASICSILKEVGWELPVNSIMSFFTSYFFGADNRSQPESAVYGREMTQMATKVLANMAKNSKDFSTLLEPKLVGYMCDVLKRSQSVETRRNVLLSFACLSSAEKTILFDNGAVNLLCLFAEDGSDSTSQWYACGGIRNLLKNSSNHRQAVVAGVIPTMVKALESKNPNAQALIAAAIAELATSAYGRAEVIRVRMADANLFASLGELLRSTNEVVLRATCKAIDNILAAVPPDDRSARKIYAQFDETDVPIFVTRLSLARIPSVVTAATSTLYTIAGIDELCDKALEAGAARIIIASCNSLDPGIAGRALDALACLSEKPSRHEYLLRASVLKMILALRSTNPIITKPLTMTVANLARSESLRAEIAHEGGLSLLSAMLSSGNIDEDSKREALRALYNLSVNGLSRVMVVQYGSLRPIINQIRSNDQLMRFLAVQTLSNLLESLEFTLKAFENGAIVPLLKCAKEGGELGCRAVLCVSEFTNLPELHQEIVRQGAVELFADVIKRGNNSEAMGYAVLGLCNLAATEEARERIRESGAVGFLSSLASASHYSPEMAAVAQAGLANLQKGEKTMTHVLPATPSLPL